MRILPVVSILFIASVQRCICNDAKSVMDDCTLSLESSDEGMTACSDSSSLSRTWDEGEDMGVRQDLTKDYNLIDDVQLVIENTRRYLAEFNFSKYRKSLKERCQTKNELCALWTARGECQINPLFMNLTCAPTCQACEYLLPEVRCPRDPNGVDRWQPGDLHKMFERITTDPKFSKYEITILSRPDDPNINSHKDDEIPQAVGTIAAHPGSPSPWVITLDRFMSSDEADYLRNFVKEDTYTPTHILFPEEERSDEPMDSNTYFSSFCTHAACLEDPILQSIMSRLVEMTNIPDENYEHLQFLRYYEGQFTATHTDFLFRHGLEQQGVRLFTVLVYMNDVQKGGETYFHHLNLTVTPRKGRVLIWPAVFNEDPNVEDIRSSHKSLPLLKGRKYALNILAHQRNFKAPHAMQCVRGLLDD